MLSLILGDGRSASFGRILTHSACTFRYIHTINILFWTTFFFPALFRFNFRFLLNETLTWCVPLVSDAKLSPVDISAEVVRQLLGDSAQVCSCIKFMIILVPLFLNNTVRFFLKPYIPPPNGTLFVSFLHVQLFGGHTPPRAVVGVPARFNKYQREATVR